MTELLQYGPWAFLIYIVLKELPKLLPQLFTHTRRTEERLFTLLESNIKADLELSQALIGLKDALNTMDRRVVNIENFVMEERRYKLIKEPKTPKLDG